MWNWQHVPGCSGKAMEVELSVPYFVPPIGPEEVEAAVRVLESGWLTTGPEAAAFEAEMAAVIGGNVEAICVSSATAGLHLALEAIGICPGDAVLVPTLTFTATAEVVRYLGAEVILVDCDPDTLNICLEDASRRMRPNVRAIMPVHFGGLAVERQPLLEFAGRHGLRIVDDAAHAFPTTSTGRMVGNWQTDATVFSFYANKTISTGEGGMVVTANPQIAARVRTMRSHGMSRDAFDRFKKIGAHWSYDVVAPGFKYNLPDIAAAIGRVQLRKAERFRIGRENAANWYYEGLAGLPLKLPSRAMQGDLHAWHLFPIQLKAECPLRRDELIENLSSHGIGTSVHYRPLHKMSYWKDQTGASPPDYPNAETYFSGALSLPLFPSMTKEQCEEVCGAIRSALV